MVDCYSLGKIFIQCALLLTNEELIPLKANDPKYEDNIEGKL